MDHPLSALIDQIIQKAEANGAFKDLAGAGKPLAHLDDPANALLKRIVREADAKAPVVIIREQILASTARLRALTDANERKAEMFVLAELQTKLALEMEAFRKYG